jgi:hypothetical protein
MAETRQATPTKYRWFMWGGLALWLASAILFAINTGPFKATPLQWTGIAGFLLFAYACIQTWRAKRLSRN